jgi:CRISPR-associated protein Csm5
MNTFLKTYRLALTPLSPIHIGCGEDFEPTNYVIDEGVLYGFDPSKATDLTEKHRTDLSRLGLQADLLGIQQFFRANKQLFKIAADVLIPVSSSFEKEYEQKLGQVVQRESDRKNVFNKLIVERAISTGASRTPFIPGSSLKGALRTSHLNNINKGKPVQYDERDPKHGAARLEKRLYEEKDFDMSPMRLVKVGDLMPKPDLHRSIVYSVMRRKRFVRDPASGEEKETQDNLATRKEVIVQGQYRSFTGQLSLMLLGDLPESDKTPKKRLQPTDLKALAHASNAYHLPKLEEEIQLLDSRRFSSESWMTSLKRLLAGELGAKIQAGTAFVIRLGRYGGAETKTLDGIRSIHIPQAKRPEDKYVSSSHCIWLAANHAKARSDMLPFGWAVVEIDPVGDLPNLKTWCDSQSKGHHDMAQFRQQFAVEKAAAQQRKANKAAEAAAQAAAREAARQADEQAAEQRAQALASMTAQGQLIETLRQQCEEWETKVISGIKKQSCESGKPGPLYQAATKLVPAALGSADWSAEDKKTLADMLEQWLPKVVTPWDAKDQRKKLKLSALRGIQ